MFIFREVTCQSQFLSRCRWRNEQCTSAATRAFAPEPRECSWGQATRNTCCCPVPPATQRDFEHVFTRHSHVNVTSVWVGHEHLLLASRCVPRAHVAVGRVAKGEDVIGWTGKALWKLNTHGALDSKMRFLIRTHPGGVEGAGSEVGIEDVVERVRLILKFRVRPEHGRLANIKSSFLLLLARLGGLGFLLNMQSILHCFVQLGVHEVRFFCEMCTASRRPRVHYRTRKNNKHGKH